MEHTSHQERSAHHTVKEQSQTHHTVAKETTATAESTIQVALPTLNDATLSVYVTCRNINNPVNGPPPAPTHYKVEIIAYQHSQSRLLTDTLNVEHTLNLAAHRPRVTHSVPLSFLFKVTLDHHAPCLRPCTFAFS